MPCCWSNHVPILCHMTHYITVECIARAVLLGHLFCYFRSCKSTSQAYSTTGNSGWLHYPSNCIPVGHGFYTQFIRPSPFVVKVGVACKTWEGGLIWFMCGRSIVVFHCSDLLQESAVQIQVMQPAYITANGSHHFTPNNYNTEWNSSKWKQGWFQIMYNHCINYNNTKLWLKQHYLPLCKQKKIYKWI